MALIDVLNQLDDKTVLNIVRKGLYVNIPDPKDAVRKGAELSSKDLKNISNSLTSLQGAMNQIYASALNIRNLHQYQQRNFQGVEKENVLEGTPNISATMSGPQLSEDGIATLLTSINEVSYNVDLLATKLRKINITGGKGTVESVVQTAVEIADDIVDIASPARTGMGILGKIPWKKAAVGAAVVGAGAVAFGGATPASAAERPTRQPDTSTQSVEAAMNRTQQAERVRAQEPTGPSYSERFADFLDRTIENVTGWVRSAGEFLGITGGGGGAMGSYPPAGSTDNARRAFEYFKSQGWSPEQAAAIVGVMQRESGPNLDPNAYNPAGGGQGAWGIAQWRADRQSGDKPMRALGVRSLRGTTFEQQLQYVQWELNNSEKAAGDALRRTTTVDQAVGSFLQNYERAAGHEAAYGQRLANAYAIYNGVASQEATGRQGRVTSGFGMRDHPVLGGRRMHRGIDIGAPTGSSVHAYIRGRVTHAGPMNGYGNTVDIDHNNDYITRYAHLSSINVSEGANVNENDIIGRVGSTGLSTGPHLHFEVHRNNQQINPISFYNERPWIVGGRAAEPVAAPRTRTGETIKGLNMMRFAVERTAQGAINHYIRRTGADRFQVWNSNAPQYRYDVTAEQARLYGTQHNIDMYKYYGI